MSSIDRRRLAAPLALILTAVVLAPCTVSAGERDYRTRRWKETWSWLATSPHDGIDAFDPVRHVAIGDDWHFSFGGSARVRFEADENRTLGASAVEDDELVRFRTFLHGELAHRDSFRWFWELRWSETWGSSRPVAPVFEDEPDVQNFFLEWTAGSRGDHPVTVRLGRQELLFGAQRLVSPLDWVSTRRTFDGLSVTIESPRSETVVFGTRPVAHEPHDIDSPLDDVLFAGVYGTFRPAPDHVVDLYAVWRDDSRDAFASEVLPGLSDQERRTFGTRWKWSVPRWAVETEWALQDGHVGADDVDAFFGTIVAERRWPEVAWKPALLVGLDVASGDEDPFDGQVETFDQLFPLGHAWFGHLDLVARQNVEAARLQVSVRPTPRTQWVAALHRFELAEERDALYDAGGAPIRRDATGKAGRDVATELDLLFAWKVNRHVSIAAELARWWSDDFVEATGSGDDAWFAWSAISFIF